MSNRELAELVRKYVEADRAIYAINSRVSEIIEADEGRPADASHCPAGLNEYRWERQLQEEFGVPAARELAGRAARELAAVMDEQGLHYVITDKHLVVRDAEELSRDFFYYDRHDGRHALTAECGRPAGQVVVKGGGGR